MKNALSATEPIAQRMSQNQLQGIDQLEDSLWAAADNLRANSKLTPSEYCMPVLGVIFLRHATNRYDAACRHMSIAHALPDREIEELDFS
jgi:type I restriction enzyme M protein